jgi:hypothetical protein
MILLRLALQQEISIMAGDKQAQRKTNKFWKTCRMFVYGRDDNNVHACIIIVWKN